MKLTKKQTLQLIVKAIQRKRDFIEAQKGSMNPQIVEMVNKSEGEIIALEAWKYSLIGEQVFLKVLAGE